MRVDHCRGCLSHNIVTVHDFGHQPLAGQYPTVPQSVSHAKKYPLELVQCAECGLLQVVNLPPIMEVFNADYRYSSSSVPGLVSHFVEYAGWLKKWLRADMRVFEFGCNDGVLLERLHSSGIECAGLDASDNVAAIARDKGLRVDTGFLTEEYVRATNSLEAYDLVTCSNVLAHIHDLSDVLRAVRALLRADGLFAIEVHNGALIIDENQFDTVYHEHLTYFTAETLRQVLERHSFDFVLCEQTRMHGGGLRVLARKCDRQRANAALRPRRELRIRRTAIFEAIDHCKSVLGDLYGKYGPLAGYGAAGRSQMFINFTDTSQCFRCVYDDSPFRQHRYIVGTDIPIVRFDGTFNRSVVVLAWNYFDDIKAKVLSKSGNVVAVLPKLRICEFQG